MKKRAFALFSICFLSLALGRSARSQISDSPGASIPFNKLTHVIVDRQRGVLSFVGQKDPEGPKGDIPYVKFLSAASRLPEEKGKAGVLGSEPGFSLELAGETGPSFEEIMEDSQSASYKINRYLLTTLDGRDPEHEEYLFQQTREEVFNFHRRHLAGKQSAEQTERDLSGVKHWPDYRVMVNSQVQRGVYNPQVDFEGIGDELQEIMDSKFYSRGQVYVFPPHAMEKIFGKKVWVAPQFYGISSTTQLARVVMNADYILKSVIGNHGFLLRSKLPYHLTGSEWYGKNLSSTRQMQRYLQSFWLSLEKLDMGVSPDGKTLTFSEPVMAIYSKAVHSDGGPNPFDGYSDFLSQHYSDYAKQFPELWEIREAMKVVAMARYFKKQGINIDIPLDVSWEAPNQLPATAELMSVGIGTRSNVVGVAGFTGGVNLQGEAQTNIQTEPPLPLEVTQGELAFNQTAQVKIGGENYEAYSIPLDSAEASALDPALSQQTLPSSSPIAQDTASAGASYGVSQPPPLESGGRLTPFPRAESSDKDKILNESQFDREIAPHEPGISFEEARNNKDKYGTCQDLDGSGDIQNWECVKPRGIFAKPEGKETDFRVLVDERKNLEKKEIEVKKEREKINEDIAREYEVKQKEVLEKAQQIIEEENRWKLQCGPGQTLNDAGYCQSWSKKIEASREFHVDWVKTEEKTIERKKIKVVGEVEVREQKLQREAEEHRQRVEAFKNKELAGEGTPKGAGQTPPTAGSGGLKTGFEFGISQKETAPSAPVIALPMLHRQESLPDAELHYQKGLEWHDKKEYNKSVEEFSEAIRLKPDYAEAFSRRGRAWTEGAEDPKAFSDLNEAVRLKPDFAEAYSFRAQAWMRLMNDYSNAAADANEAIRLQPNFSEPYRILGLVAYYGEDYDKAIEYFTKAIQYPPLYLKDAQAFGYRERAGAWGKKGEKDKADADRKEFFRLAKDQEEVYKYSGFWSLDKGEIDKSITYLSEAVRLNPKNADNYLTRSAALDRKKQPEKAIADLDEAIRLKPNFMEAYNNRGLIFYNQQDYDKALADLNEAIRLRPSGLSYFNRGLVWWAKDELDKAFADFSKALEVRANYPEALYRRGRVLLVQGKLKEGLSEVEAGIKLLKSPEDFQLAGLAAARWVNGQKREALEIFRAVAGRHSAILNASDDWKPQWKESELKALREMARELDKTPGGRRRISSKSKDSILDSAEDTLDSILSLF